MVQKKREKFWEQLLERAEAERKVEKGWKEVDVTQEETHVLGERGGKKFKTFLMQVINCLARTTSLWDNLNQDL